MSAKVMDYEGIKELLDRAKGLSIPRLSHLWLEAGYTAERIRVATTGWRRRLGGRWRSSGDRVKTCSRGSANSVGAAAVGQGRCGSGLAAAHATAGIHSPATPLGRGENVCLDLSQPKDEQGLRAASRYE